MAGEISFLQICFFVFHRCNFVARQCRRIKNFYVMSKTSQPSRIDLLKEVKSNVNAVAFSPTESRKADALKSIDALRSFVEAIEMPKPKASKSKSEPKATKADDVMAEMLKAFLVSNPELLAKLTDGDDEPPFEPDPKPKAKRKASKKPNKPVTSPRRSSNDGVELSQARTKTSTKVGTVKKTKVVSAVTGGEAQPLEPRKEVEVVAPAKRVTSPEAPVPFSELRDMGLTDVGDAIRFVAMTDMMDDGITFDDIL